MPIIHAPFAARQLPVFSYVSETASILPAQHVPQCPVIASSNPLVSGITYAFRHALTPASKDGVSTSPQRTSLRGGSLPVPP